MEGGSCQPALDGLERHRQEAHQVGEHTRAVRVPLRRSPVEMPKRARIQASRLLSIQAKGMMTPMAITVPGTA
jgi:hypothetical protein